MEYFEYRFGYKYNFSRNDKFGNLFEIECEEDEILLSSASIDDVQIITKITEHNIRIGE